MKLLRSVFLVSSLFSLSLMAQRGGGHGGGGGGHVGGGGGYAAGGFRGGYGGGYGGYRGGFYGGYGYGFGLGWGLGYGWGYPYYYGGYPYAYDPYYYGYPATSYYAAPGYGAGYTASVPAQPQTQTYAATQTPSYPQAQAAPAQVYPVSVSESTYYRPADYYLIAFTDHSIRAASSYQVIGDQIEWRPKEGGDVQRAPLASVDRNFSAQINRDRRVKFSLVE